MRMTDVDPGMLKIVQGWVVYRICPFSERRAQNKDSARCRRRRTPIPKLLHSSTHRKNLDPHLLAMIFLSQ